MIEDKYTPMDGVYISPDGSKTDYVSHYPVKIQLFHPEAQIPKKGTLDSAGYDLLAISPCRIQALQTECIPLGFSTSMPHNIHGRIESRSGMAVKGLVVLTGVIDADYRGEWKVILRNVTNAPQDIAKGQRIAQVVFRPTLAVSFEVSDALESSERGSGGFGSTGS